ncbi:MAG: VOC family protein [Pseudomonadota bacterium]
MQLFPYLTFDGNAAAAATFYASIMGDPPPEMMRFGDMQGEDWVTDEIKDRVAHTRVSFANSHIMISDSSGFESFNGHSGFSMNVTMEDVEDGEELFRKLADGGQVTMAWAPTFWAKGFGVCKDRFGVSWMVNVE